MKHHLRGNPIIPATGHGSTNKGFALVATLSLMILLGLLAVGMLSLSTISLRGDSQGSATAEARANARFALMVAIGELQKKMGPDKRISARALTLSQDGRIGSPVAPNNPRSWWVGVAGTDPAFGLDGVNTVSTGNPAAVWLVSGLDPNASAADQLTKPFGKPVDMFDGYSTDLSMTGGQPLTAGIVPVGGSNNNLLGGYAYFIDDDGMKAQLAPSNVNLVNGRTPVNSSELTPGAYDLSILNGMSALNGNPLSNYTKIMSVGDLAMVGGNNALAANRRLGYTTYSRGVLCDVKRGGLKRDLTAAFENDTTFDQVFPAGNTADYLVMDADKLSTCTDLQTNGYIHWDVFKDYYTIKKYIKTHTDGTKYLDPVRYSKAGVMMANNGFPYPGWAINPAGEPSGNAGGSLFMAGRLGPHSIGNATTSLYPEMAGIPYSDYRVDDTNPRTSKNHREFKHSPVMPILQRFQANAWMEQLDANTLRTHAQIWSSHYNPYNISLYAYGWTGGARILGTPKISAFSTALNGIKFKRKKADGTFYMTNPAPPAVPVPILSWLRDADFTSNKYQFQSKEPVMLLPGRGHILAYENSAHVDNSADGFLYSDKVKPLTVESVYQEMETETTTPLPASYDMKIRMSLLFASMHSGIDDNNGGPGNFEVFQSLWAPFAWGTWVGSTRPGKEFDLGTVSAATLNENKMASLGFNLRTTRESGSTIRPLVDANIRCMFGNTRWDSPMNLPLLASYSAENGGAVNEMIMDMDTVDDPKGYSYWGAARDPSYGHSRVILFDIPRSDLVSLGQLQHAGAGRFSYEPTYIAGNSYANPRIQQTNWKESISDTFSTAARGLNIFPINGSFNLYDASYLVNEVLWDRYTFTTIPQVADNVTTLTEPTPNDAHFTALSAGTANLPNARFLPYTPPGSTFDRTTLQMASNKTNATGAFYHNAGHLVVDGAFNVNSTSVDAWEAFLTGTHSMPVQKLNAKGVITGFEAQETVRFPRVQTLFGSGVKKDDLDENFWVGFRALEQTEVRALAQAVVDEVKKRGPFTSMAQFVNRKLVAGELGASGALQAALDRTVNSGIDGDFASGTQGAGFPGQLLQGDVLQALAPTMTVRSDVFTIRAYGESVSSTTGSTLARAWCEAKVQRVPDPVGSASSGMSALQELANPTSPFGRRFNVLSFRWISPDEI